LVSVAILLLAASVADGNDDLLFPQPAELDRDVDFWLAVFTDYTTSEGVLHDSRDLSIVYERLPIPDNASRRQRQRITDKHRQRYKKILQTLASGKRTGLRAVEQRVLVMWPADVSNEELKAAANRIRFQLGLSDRFQEGLRRAGRYRNYVDKEFSRLGVPLELAALPHVESSYNTEARSHVGASGIWQFTRSTGRRFLRIDHVLDERNDPFLATTAAGKLLAYNYSIVGNWPMAITAYNHGLAGVRRAMRRFGNENYAKILHDYNSRTFGFASRNFYVAFLAAKEVDRNTDRYFPGLVPYSPVEYSSLRLDAYIPADKLAAVLHVRERDLARHNPALQPAIWQGSKYLPKNYSIRMPSSMVNGSLRRIVATLPPDAVFNKQLPDLFHTVVRGDTLSGIADAYGTRVSTLVALNNLSSRNRIRAGRRIRLPAAGPAPAVQPPVAVEASVPQAAPPLASLADAPAIGSIPEDEGETPGALANQLSDFIGSLQASLLSDPSDYTVASDNTIEVYPLETLGHYADWLGLRTQRLWDLNYMAFRTPVAVGKRIKLDFSEASIDQFEALRTRYHRQQQDTFFRSHTITGVKEHVVRSGESVWILSLHRYGVPIWLFRQYNPEVDMDNVRPGTRLNFPLLIETARG